MSFSVTLPCHHLHYASYLYVFRETQSHEAARPATKWTCGSGLSGAGYLLPPPEPAPVRGPGRSDRRLRGRGRAGAVRRRGYPGAAGVAGSCRRVTRETPRHPILFHSLNRIFMLPFFGPAFFLLFMLSTFLLVRRLCC